ncbi:unnamed protein product [Paramecium primaurelia]|uniref:EGF-like domain-containing protein n=1 Tax=Paramecium primaurelia TaxID=5886 RepID=A0A8S1QP00_PARPR|nr:unnamed protein product [Paramecium primaurelia]
MCDQCQFPCLTCETTASTCLSCSLTYTLISNSCSCQINEFEADTNPKSCFGCLSPCNTCSGSSTNCQSCITGLNRHLNNQTCICDDSYFEDESCKPCKLPCKNCSSENTCLSCNDQLIQILPQCNCQDGYFMDQSFQCQQCSHPCIKCHIDSNSCLECASTFNINNITKICYCLDGYYEDLNYNPSKCELCIGTCKTCKNSSTFCLSCIDEHQLINELNQCICQDGYVLIGNSCELYVPPCIKCQTTTETCTLCQDIHHIIENGKCKCDQGWISDQNNNCIKCQLLCQTCSETQNHCDSCNDDNHILNENFNSICKDSFYADSLSSCTPCQPLCATCDQYGCLTCLDTNQILINNQCKCQNEYYMNNYSCQGCQKPCLNCTISANHCLSCVDNTKYILEQNICNCRDGYYFSENLCLKCSPQYTNLISIQNKCQCQIGSYYNEDFKFQLCKVGCISCYSQENCTECQEQYQLNDVQQCLNCIENCKLCQDYQSCDQCQDGYFFVDNQCKECIPDCKTCVNQSDNCTSCLQTFDLVDNKCICKQGYYRDNVDCFQCQFPCGICISQKICTQCSQIQHIILENDSCVCQQGYYLSNQNQCLECNFRCKSCNSQVECTKCFIEQNRILQNNDCICNSEYFESENNECLSCNSIEGKSKEDCKYKDCTDKQWTYGEDCDDGNTIERDGCTNCKIDPNYKCINKILEPSICFKCNDNCNQCDFSKSLNSTICTKCEQGYFIKQSVCVKCAQQCLQCINSASNCTSCRFKQNIQGQCVKCEDIVGLYSNFENNTCYSKCGDGIMSVDEECDDSNILNGDGCDRSCRLEKQFICKGSVCIQPELPIPILIQAGDHSLYNNIRLFQLSYNILIEFNNDIDFNKDVEIIILNGQEEINIKQQCDISSDMNRINSSQLNLTVNFLISFNQSIKNQELKISFTNLSHFKSNNGYQQQQQIVTTKIADIIFVDATTVEQVEMASSSNQYILYAIGTMSGTALLFGGLDIFYNLLDTIQILSYLKYINSQFPFNLQEFFNCFEFVQMNFIQKYFNFYDLFNFSLINENFNNIPLKIKQDNLTPLFIINSASVIFIWFTLILIYIVSKKIPYYLHRLDFKYYDDIPNKKPSLILKIKYLILAMKISITSFCLKVLREFFCSGIYRVLITTAYDFNFAIVLQLYSLDIMSQNILIRLSSILALLTFFFYLFIIFHIIKLSSQDKYAFANYQNNLKYGTLFEGIKKNNVGKYFNAILLIKKLFFMLTVIFCYEAPSVQIINLIIFTSVQAYFLLSFKPLTDSKEFIKQFSCELIITVISLDAIQQWIFLLQKQKKFKRFINNLLKLFKPTLLKAIDHNILLGNVILFQLYDSMKVN